MFSENGRGGNPIWTRSAEGRETSIWLPDHLSTMQESCHGPYRPRWSRHVRRTMVGSSPPGPPPPASIRGLYLAGCTFSEARAGHSRPRSRTRSMGVKNGEGHPVHRKRYGTDCWPLHPGVGVVTREEVGSPSSSRAPVNPASHHVRTTGSSLPSRWYSAADKTGKTTRELQSSHPRD